MYLYVWIPPVVGLDPVAQSPQLLTSTYMSPQSPSPTPFSGTDPYTDTVFPQRTCCLRIPTVAGLEYTVHLAASWSGILNLSRSLTLRDTHTCAHTVFLAGGHDSLGLSSTQIPLSCP